jgi:DNA-binding CsgD family transcriptional regulator
MKEKILELRRKGLTINQIVKELGCAKSTVSYHINSVTLNDLEGDFLNSIGLDTINLIKEMRLNFKTYPEILKVVNISEDKLKKICSFLNLNKARHNINSLNGDEIIKKYLEIKSLKKVAKFFGTTYDTIRKHVPDDMLIVKIKTKTSSESVVEWRQRTKIKLVEYKGGCCERCGYNKSNSVLQFHHLNPQEKDFNIGNKSYSFERIKKEVDKCIMVCANCHIEIHEEERNK